MKIKNLLKINMFFLVILLSLNVALAVTPALDVSIAVNPDKLKPSDFGIFTVSIKNTHSSVTAESLAVSLAKGDTPIKLTKEDVTIGNIYPLDTESTAFPFAVSSDAEEGIYSVRFEIVYSGSDSSTVYIYRDVPVNITNPEKKIIFEITEVSKNKTKLVPGDSVILNFNLANYGKEDAKDVRISLVQDEQIFVTKDMNSNIYIGNMPAKTSKEIPINLMINPKITSGQYDFTLQINYANSQGTEQSAVNKNIGIEIQEDKDMIDIKLNKKAINLGETTGLNFTIKNNKEFPLQNLVFSWSEKNGVILPLYSSNTRYLKSIGAGESVDIEYMVVANIGAQTGLYQLDLNLKYETETGASKEITTGAGIFVGGETDFDITLSESSSEYTSFYITNIGNNPALSVTVKVPQQENFRVTGSTASIIGNLDTGDYTIVSFKISQLNFSSIRGNRTGQFPAQFPQERSSLNNSNFKILIEYTDTTGGRHSIEKNIPAQFLSLSETELPTGMAGFAGRFRQQQPDFSLIIALIIIVPVLIAVGIIGYKKRKILSVFLKKVLSKKGKE